MSLAGARLFHVNVNCSDLARSRRFYTEGLGLTDGARTAPERAQPGGAFGLDVARWDASILLGPHGYEGGTIDLLEWREPAPAGTPPSGITETGFQRIGMQVPDLDAAIGAARRFAGQVWSAPFEHTFEAGGTVRLVLVGDPDGTAIELIEAGPAKVSFVAVACADLERSRAFYRSLGFRELGSYPSENADGSHLRIAGPVVMDEIVLGAPGGGETLVMLTGFRTPKCAPAPARAANTLGIWRAAFLVGQLDAAIAELRRLGIVTMSAPAEMSMGPGLPALRFVCFRGPDHEVLELIEQPRPRSRA